MIFTIIQHVVESHFYIRSSSCAWNISPVPPYATLRLGKNNLGYGDGDGIEVERSEESLRRVSKTVGINQ